MRIARIGTKDSTPGFAVDRDGGGWLPLSAKGIEAFSTADVIAHIPEIQASMAGTSDTDVVEDPDSLSPIVTPTKILAIGFNYLDHLTPGDVVECEVEDLGRLRNPVVGPTGA